MRAARTLYFSRLALIFFYKLFISCFFCILDSSADILFLSEWFSSLDSYPFWSYFFHFAILTIESSVYLLSSVSLRPFLPGCFFFSSLAFCFFNRLLSLLTGCSGSSSEADFYSYNYGFSNGKCIKEPFAD